MKAKKTQLQNTFERISKEKPRRIPVNYKLMSHVDNESFARIAPSSYYNSKSMYCNVFYKPICQFL